MPDTADPAEPVAEPPASLVHHDGSSVERIAYLTPVLTDAKVQPWRIIDEAGVEVWWEHEPFEHPTAGVIDVPRAGYATKADATDAILRFADKRIEALRDELADALGDLDGHRAGVDVNRPPS